MSQLRIMASPWSRATRAAFRFSFLYLGLYCLATQFYAGLFVLPGVSLPGLGLVWPLRGITVWVATHVFRVTSGLVPSGNSGDMQFHWVQTFCLLVLAAAGTVIWSLGDTTRREYVTLHKWFRVFVRFVLAAQMFSYGMAKVIPTQFQPPSLVTLVEPVGNLSITDLLWTSIGASTSYQMFTGWAEMLGGVLLLFPRTTALGALVCLADMIQVLVLNATYDFGLKQISFHLILLTLFLLAPDARRLANLFFLNRVAEPSSEPPLFATPQTNRLALYAQIAFGVFLIANFARIASSYWYGDGEPGGPKSPLYGIWDVDEMSVDGEVRLTQLNDYDRRWRRVIFDTASRMAFQRTDDSFVHYNVSVDVEGRQVLLTKKYSRTWRARFTFERPSDSRLTLRGEMDGHTIDLRLNRVEVDTFRLLNSPFRWVRPPD